MKRYWLTGTDKSFEPCNTIWDKMAPILQTTSSNAFCWQKIYEFQCFCFLVLHKLYQRKTTRQWNTCTRFLIYYRQTFIFTCTKLFTISQKYPLSTEAKSVNFSTQDIHDHFTNDLKPLNHIHISQVPLKLLWQHFYLTLPMLKTKYSKKTRSIPWQLMPWLLSWPGHQPPWYGQCRINCLPWWSISATCVVTGLRNDRKCKYIFTFPRIGSAWRELKDEQWCYNNENMSTGEWNWLVRLLSADEI